MNSDINNQKDETTPGDLNLENLDQRKNILLDEKKGYAFIKLNPQIHPVEAVQFAAHHLSGKANVIIDMDSDKMVLIEIFSKDKKDSIKTIFWEFNESVNAFTVYLIQSVRNKEFREAILKKALSLE